MTLLHGDMVGGGAVLGVDPALGLHQAVQLAAIVFLALDAGPGGVVGNVHAGDVDCITVLVAEVDAARVAARHLVPAVRSRGCPPRALECPEVLEAVKAAVIPTEELRAGRVAVIL